MAVTRACGHEEEISVRGDPVRSRYVDQARERDCTACYRKRGSDADAAAVASGRRAELDGSERQVEWARGLRQRRATEFLALLQECVLAGTARGASRDVVDGIANHVRATLGEVMQGKVTWELGDASEAAEVASGEARWWIETRGMDARGMLATLLGVDALDATWRAVYEAKDDDDDGRDVVDGLDLGGLL